MLLYDRVLAQAWLFAHRNPDLFDERHQTVFEQIRSAPVYEVTDLIALFPDWEREKDKSIPKRPPHSPIWVEWKHREGDTTPGQDWWVDWILATLITEVERNTMTAAMEI